MPSRMMKNANKQSKGRRERREEKHLGQPHVRLRIGRRADGDEQSRRVDIGIGVGLYCLLESLLLVNYWSAAYVLVIPSYLAGWNERCISFIARVARYSGWISFVGIHAAGERLAKQEHFYPECFRNPSIALMMYVMATTKMMIGRPWRRRRLVSDRRKAVDFPRGEKTNVDSIGGAFVLAKQSYGLWRARKESTAPKPSTWSGQWCSVVSTALAHLSRPNQYICLTHIGVDPRWAAQRNVSIESYRSCDVGRSAVCISF
jgi:hypothetical protein